MLIGVKRGVSTVDFRNFRPQSPGTSSATIPHVRPLKSRGNDVTDEDANHAMTGTQLARLGITDDGCSVVWVFGVDVAAQPYTTLGRVGRTDGTVAFWQRPWVRQEGG